MSHALRIRDGSCRYPGCCQTQYTDAHHIQHWAEGSETSLSNLLTLCRFHHGSLHKGEYRIERGESGDVIFINKHNQVVRQSIYPQFERVTAIPTNPEINADTANCKWLGEQMDVQQALCCLYQLDEKSDNSVAES